MRAFRPTNSKSYWTAHKEVFETSVRGPLVDLFAELEDEFGAAGGGRRRGRRRTGN